MKILYETKWKSGHVEGQEARMSVEFDADSPGEAAWMGHQFAGTTLAFIKAHDAEVARLLGIDPPAAPKWKPSPS